MDAQRALAAFAVTAMADPQYDFDLFTIGAGSGGVRASRISASYGAKVAVRLERPESSEFTAPSRHISTSNLAAGDIPAALDLAHPPPLSSPQVCEMPYSTKASDTAGGAGGTCVLRGCVPKKLLVFGSSYGCALRCAAAFCVVVFFSLPLPVLRPCLAPSGLLFALNSSRAFAAHE